MNRHPWNTLLTAVLVVLTTAPLLAQQPATQPATQPAAGGPGWLGAKLDNISDEIANNLELESTDGVLVVEVLPDTPAMLAGLQAGDIIRRMDQTAITEVRDLQKVMAASRPGQMMVLTVLRGKETRELKVTLGDRPAVIPG